MAGQITRRGMVGRAARAAAGLAAAAATGSVGTARAQSAPKTFVLLHGAFFGGWCWRRVSGRLQKQGHNVYRPTFTGLGDRSHLLGKEIDIDTHVMDIVNLIKWEDLQDICLVAHSYGGSPGSTILDHIGERVSSVVWLDAFKPDNGQRMIDLTEGPILKVVQAAAEKGEAGFGPPPRELPTFVINAKDAPYVKSETTAQPTGTYLQPIRVSNGREKIAKKTFVRIPKYPSHAFDKALAECRADKSWNTEIFPDSGHIAMLDAPERLTELLLQAA